MRRISKARLQYRTVLVVSVFYNLELPVIIDRDRCVALRHCVSWMSKIGNLRWWKKKKFQRRPKFFSQAWLSYEKHWATLLQSSEYVSGFLYHVYVNIDL